MPDPARQSTPPKRTRRPLGPDTRAIILAGGAVVVLVLVLGILTLVPMFRNRDNNNLGDDVYQIRASTVRATTPVLVNDLVGGDRPMWITHTGSDETEGFHAFAAVTDDGCLIAVDRQTLELHRACDDQPVPPDGAGLTQYEVTYDDGELRIDLNAPSP